jgi:Zn-dependent protease
MNLRNPRKDMVLVALAGPMTNLVLAAVSAFAFNFLQAVQVPKESLLATNIGVLTLMAGHSVLMNIGLAVFNMLPVPPLDGGRVAAGLLPRSPAVVLARLEPYGMLIILVLLATGALDQVLRPMTKFLVQTLL